MANAAAAVAVGKKGTATVTRRSAAENPAARVAGGRREDRARWRRSRRASLGLAPAGAAHRLHQWLLRLFASRPRQGADGRAPRLRPAHRRSQQRCLGEAIEGRGTPGSGRKRARRSAGGAGGGRSRGDLRGGHADRPDRDGEAERAGQGWRLHPRAGRRLRDRRGNGGEVVLVDILPGHSTTSLVDRARGGKE